MADHSHSFEIDEVDLNDDVVVVVLAGNFTKLIADHLATNRNPAVQALAHYIRHSGMILSGHKKPEDFPHLKDAVREKDVGQGELVLS